MRAATILEILLDISTLDILNKVGGVAALCVLECLQDRCTPALVSGCAGWL